MGMMTMKNFQLGRYTGLNIRSFSTFVKDEEIDETLAYLRNAVAEHEAESLGAPVFHVQEQSVERPLSADEINEIAPGLHTLDELKEKLREVIHWHKVKRQREANILSLFQRLIAECTCEYDAEELDKGAQVVYKEFADELLANDGMEMIVYLIGRKLTAEEFLLECREEAVRRIARDSILDSVITLEGIRLTEQENEDLREKLEKNINQPSLEGQEAMFRDAEKFFLRHKATEYLLQANMIN